MAVHRYKLCTPRGWDTPALCTNQFLFAFHNVCSELADPAVPSVRNVQAYLYKMLCERMPDPFTALGELVEDRFSLFAEHYNAELCSSNADCNFSEYEPELMHFKEF